MVEKVKANFKNVIVVMNVGGMVDTSWFKDCKEIPAVLMAWQGGMEGGLAAADVVTGDVNPSGKLVDTYAATLEDYPSTENFHKSVYYVDYNEDIYVGYRYFETIPGAAEKVNYPFGFGLSYTSFETEVLGAEEKDGKIVVKASVTNTGKRAGKEVYSSTMAHRRASLANRPKSSALTGNKTAAARRDTESRSFLYSGRNGIF